MDAKATKEQEGSVDEHGVELTLRLAAEREMRRVLAEGDERAPKRPRTGHAIGRFDYGAAAELAEGAAGFVLTCHMNREQSALKEAGGLLIERIRRQLGQPAADAVGDAPQAAESDAPDESEAEDAGSDHDADQAPEPLLHSIKLACRGVVALKLALPDSSVTSDSSGAEAPAPSRIVLEVVRSILADMDAGVLQRMPHLQRIVPMQTSTVLGLTELRAAAARLAPGVAAELVAGAGVACTGASSAGRADAAGAAASGSTDQGKRISYAVAYSGRGGDFKPQSATQLELTGGGSSGGAGQEAGAAGVEAVDRPAPGTGSTPSEQERLAAIGAIAGGFSGALAELGVEGKVDLTRPDWVLLAEVLPMAGRPHVGLAAVPAEMCFFGAKTSVKNVGVQFQGKGKKKHGGSGRSDRRGGGGGRRGSGRRV